MATLGDIFGNSGPAIGDYGGAIGDRTMGGVNPAPKKKIDWWKVAGVLGDALQATGGGQGTYLPMLQQQRLLEQQDQRDWNKAEREYQMNTRLIDYRAAHIPPKQDDLTRLMVQAGIDPNSDTARGLYTQAAQNKANPVRYVTYPDGSVHAMQNTPPSAPVGKLTPLSAPDNNAQMRQLLINSYGPVEGERRYQAAMAQHNVITGGQ